MIDRYVAVLNPAKIGCFTRIRLDQQDEETLQTFAREILKLPQVLECYFMLGDYDAMIRVVAADIEEYRRFQSEYLEPDQGRAEPQDRRAEPDGEADIGNAALIPPG